MILIRMEKLTRFKKEKKLEKVPLKMKKELLSKNSQLSSQKLKRYLQFLNLEHSILIFKLFKMNLKKNLSRIKFLSLNVAFAAIIKI